MSTTTSTVKHTCNHRICKFVDTSGTEKRWTSTAKYDSALRKHVKVSNYHPCCNAEKKEFCDEKFAKVKEWRESLLNRNVKTSNICDHKNCKRAFPTLVARNTHNGTAHRCHEKCSLCEKYLEKHRITAPCEEEEKDEEDNEPTYLTMDDIFQEPPTKFRKLNDGNVHEIIRGDTISAFKVGGEYYCCDYASMNLSNCKRIEKIQQWIQVNVSSPLEYFNVLVNLTAEFWNKLLSSSFEEALKILRTNFAASSAIIQSALYSSGLFNNCPTLDALLQFKDELKISDKNWKKVVETFNLPASCSTYRIVKYRQSIANDLTPQITPSGCGYSFLIRQLIRKAIVTENIPVDADINVKISLDAGTIIKGAKTQAEIVQMDVVSINQEPKPTSKAKSPKNSYIISIFSAEDGSNPETNANLKNELDVLRNEIKELLEQKKIVIEDEEGKSKSFGVNLLLCCDMKCLTEVYGLVSVFLSKSTYCCPWCECEQKNIGNFEFESLSTRKANSVKYCGQYGEPLFDLPLENVIPCNLHATMSISKTLRKHLQNLIEDFPQAQEYLLNTLTQNPFNIKIMKANDKVKTFIERINKSRITRPKAVLILKHHDLLLKCLDYTNITDEEKKNLKKCWEQLVLLAIASSPNPPLQLSL